jgi:hypothetical protein
MSLELVHPEERASVNAINLINKCSLFKANLALLGAPYEIKSTTPIQAFRDLVSAINDDPVEITAANFDGLSLLSAELGFEALAARLSEFQPSAPATSASLS